MDIIFDIETAPLEFRKHMYVDEKTGEEKDIGALSPITGRITAIGWKNGETQHIFAEEDEKTNLEKFWKSIEIAAGPTSFIRLVGFNIKDFDIHFLLVRCLQHNVKILKFNHRQVIDLRSHLAFFNTYKRKGKLRDYAKILGIDGKFEDLDGEQIPLLWKDGKIDILKEYLANDLRITEALYLKCKELGILGDY